MSGTWSALVGAALAAKVPVGNTPVEEAPADEAPELPPDAAGAVVERLSVRSGEVVARVRGPGGTRETSLIRAELSDAEWERACAALASQPVFRARLLAGELPVAAARVFSVLGLPLVPRDWTGLVATCSCEQWRGRCVHLAATAAELGAEADRDPFTLTRWLGRDRRALMEQLRAFSGPNTKGPRVDETTFGDNYGTQVINAGETDSAAAEASEGIGDRASARAFWSAPPLPTPPRLPEDSGRRVRAAAPGSVADELPFFSSPGEAPGPS